MNLPNLRFLSSVVALVLLAPLGVGAEEAAEHVLARFRAALELEAAGDASGSAAAYAEVLRLDPEHLAARRALGYEKVDGVWLAGAELKRARGLVLGGDVRVGVVSNPGASTSSPTIEAPSLSALVQRALHASSAATRAAAAQELKRRGLLGAAAALARGLASTTTATRVHAAQALGLLGDTAVIHTLIAHWQARSSGGPRAYFAQTAQTSYIGDFDVEVA